MSGKEPCYVASQLGFSEAGRCYYTRVLLPALGAVVEVVDPWQLTSQAEILQASLSGEQRRFTAEVGRRNSAAISKCGLLVAVLDGQEIDPGTAAEVGYASALGLTCFGLRTDVRQTGEPGALVNLQVEAFITQSGGQIVPSLDELVASLVAAVESLRHGRSVTA